MRGAIFKPRIHNVFEWSVKNRSHSTGRKRAKVKTVKFLHINLLRVVYFWEGTNSGVDINYVQCATDVDEMPLRERTFRPPQMTFVNCTAVKYFTNNGINLFDIIFYGNVSSLIFGRSSRTCRIWMGKIALNDTFYTWILNSFIHLCYGITTTV